MGIGFLGIGFQPKWGLKDIPVMPKVFIILIPTIHLDGRVRENLFAFFKNCF